MSAVTIPRPDVTVEEVSATLRHGLGPGYQVLPGMKTPVLPGEPDPGWPDSIVVGTGSAHVFRAQLRVDRRDGQTRIRVDPAGLVVDPARQHVPDRPQGPPRAADRIRHLAGGRPGPGPGPGPGRLPIPGRP